MAAQLIETDRLTDQVFATNLQLPKPNVHLQRRLEALQEASLRRQATECSFEIRCDQAEQLGFQRVTLDEMAEMLTGEQPTVNHRTFYDHEKIKIGETSHTFRPYRQPLAWYWDHETNTTYTDRTHTIQARLKQDGVDRFFNRAPYKWFCLYGCVDLLKRQVPYGVALRMVEAKKLKLFNRFMAMAPIQAWQLAKTTVDPVVVAEIRSSMADADDVNVACYFLAHW